MVWGEVGGVNSANEGESGIWCDWCWDYFPWRVQLQLPLLHVPSVSLWRVLFVKPVFSLCWLYLAPPQNHPSSLRESICLVMMKNIGELWPESVWANLANYTFGLSCCLNLLFYQIIRNANLKFIRFSVRLESSNEVDASNNQLLRDWI